LDLFVERHYIFKTIYCEEDMSAVCSFSCLQIAYYTGRHADS